MPTVRLAVALPSPSPTAESAQAALPSEPTPVPSSTQVQASTDATPAREAWPTPAPTPLSSEAVGQNRQSVGGQPSTVFDIDALNREAMADTQSFDLAIQLTYRGGPYEGTLRLQGRYGAPGALWVEVTRRRGADKTVGAGEYTRQPTELERGWDGSQAVVDDTGVHVRYRDHSGGDKPVETDALTEWYRIDYAGWPRERPDVYTDASGILARLLPHVARGFPAPAEDVERTRLIPTDEIDGDTYFLPIALEGIKAPEDVHLIEYMNAFEPHFTGVSRIVGQIWKVIDRDTYRTLALLANPTVGSDGAKFIFSDYDAEDAVGVAIPQTALEFDRDAHHELR